jgi:hypothetical protein
VSTASVAENTTAVTTSRPATRCRHDVHCSIAAAPTRRASRSTRSTGALSFFGAPDYEAPT